MTKSRRAKLSNHRTARGSDELGLRPGNVLLWELVSGTSRMRPTSRVLARRGAIEVGPGSTFEDVRRQVEKTWLRTSTGRRRRRVVLAVYK